MLKKPKQDKKMLHSKADLQSANRGERLSDIILGGQDGLVNTLGVVLGLAAVAGDLKVIVAGGLAGAVAEAISMGAVGYTSKIAERDFYYSQKAREIREMELIPEMEKEEIREIYRKKGFEGDLLEKVVEVITSNHQVWLDTMMTEELNLAEVDASRPLTAAIWVGLSALIGSLVPLLPFLILFFTGNILNGDRIIIVIISLIVSALTLFLLGAFKAKLTVGKWYRSGLQITLIGIVSALFGYVIGYLFNVQI